MGDLYAGSSYEDELSAALQMLGNQLSGPQQQAPSKTFKQSQHK
jgi:hypothetical protein